MSPDDELRLFRFLARLQAKLKETRDVDRVARSALRETVEHFEASAGCLAAPKPGAREADVLFSIPSDASWDLRLLTRFHNRDRPSIPDDVLIAPLHRRGRTWQVLALRRDTPFAPGRQKILFQITRAVSSLVRDIDRERITDVRAKIERKIMEELRPKDLFYQILHGLRSLTGYDHSSALLIAGERGDTLELVAEQIAWRKGKSERIGLRIPMSAELGRMMTAGAVYGFDRRGDTWRELRGRPATDLAGLLDYNEAPDLREAALLCGPLVTRDGVMGVLKVASRHAGSLGRYEADLVRRFMPQAAVAIQNSRRAETLQARMLEAEKKNAMADLARSVSHDVNNALGSVIPLVQQIREDAGDGEVDTSVLSEDLGQIERSLQVCTRIFGGMLAFARGAARGSGPVDVRAAVEGALTILKDGMRRRRIDVRLALPGELPPVRGSRSDLEQVLFNLMANARDAMPRGGTLSVDGVVDGDRVTIGVEDTGAGIPEADLQRILEPFFTTKVQGSGLGLAICRSLVWEMRGRMDIRSEQGAGTRVELTLPLDGDATAREAR